MPFPQVPFPYVPLPPAEAHQQPLNRLLRVLLDQTPGRQEEKNPMAQKMADDPAQLRELADAIRREAAEEADKLVEKAIQLEQHDPPWRKLAERLADMPVGTVIQFEKAWRRQVHHIGTDSNEGVVSKASGGYSYAAIKTSAGWYHTGWKSRSQGVDPGYSSEAFAQWLIGYLAGSGQPVRRIQRLRLLSTIDLERL
jgi:hypothetical protein